MIDKVVGVPPESVQAKVEVAPEVMDAGEAVKVLIMGTAGLTVTVTDLLAVPALLVAVRV